MSMIGGGGGSALTKRFHRFHSRLVLNPLKRFMGFDPLLSNSVHLCFQEGHQRSGV